MGTLSAVSNPRRSLKIIEDVNDQKIKVETAFHLFRGAVYHKRGQLSKAISEYSTAIEITPEYAPSSVLMISKKPVIPCISRPQIEKRPLRDISWRTFRRFLGSSQTCANEAGV
jgi:hypothetical protein